VIVAFKCGVYNVGAEGQYILGGLFTILAAISIPEMPTPAALFVLIAASFAGGSLWAFIPAILKVRQNVNELLSTLLLNYVALFLMQFLLRDWMRDKTLPVYYPVSRPIPPFAVPPVIIQGYSMTVTIIIAVVFALATYLIMQKTRFGFEVRAVGLNPDASAFSGINVNTTRFISMILSGGIAGVAGFAEVGFLTKVNMQFSSGYGYTGILLALISQLNPLPLILVSIFFAGLDTGAQGLRIFGVSIHITTVMEGAIIAIFLLIRPVIQKMLERRRTIRNGIQAREPESKEGRGIG